MPGAAGPISEQRSSTPAASRRSAGTGQQLGWVCAIAERSRCRGWPVETRGARQNCNLGVPVQTG